MTKQEVAEQIAVLNSHIDQISSYYTVINQAEYPGQDCETVASMKRYFSQINTQLQDQLETAAQLQFHIETTEADENV